MSKERKTSKETKMSKESIIPPMVNMMTLYSAPEDIKLRSIDISDPKILQEEPNRRRRSPILVEFVDPNVSSLDLGRSLELGANIVKFRMAFSSKSQKIDMLGRMDTATLHCAARLGVPMCPIATCASLKTWVKKIGIFEDGMGNIEQDSEIILTCNRSLIHACTPDMVYLDYSQIASVPIGTEITIGQGTVAMRCTKIRDSESIICNVHKGGTPKNLETAYFRNHKNNTPYISKIDVSILKFCSQYQINLLLIYYASNREMIRKIKHVISKAKFKPLVFSGICNQDGIDNLEEILQESDGIMLCREFLTYELETKQVFRIPLFQKWASGKCQLVGKPMFISGIFENVLIDGVVTGSDVADVTNSLMDGVTGFSLRDCYDINTTLTAIGALNQICCQVEPLTFDKNTFWRMLREHQMPVNAAEAAVLSCVAAANQTNARVVVISTISGRTARFLLWLRPACIIITVCTRPQAAKLLFTFRNIVPLIYTGDYNKQWHLIEEDRVKYAEQFAVMKHWMEYGDTYVAMQRSYKGHLFCDMVKVRTVTIAKKMLVECHYSSEEEPDRDQSKESIIEEKPVKKKRRRKKKKPEEVLGEQEQKADGEQTSETDVTKDEDTSGAQNKESTD